MTSGSNREQLRLPKELRRTGVPAAARAWIARATGQPVHRWRRLPGATTSAVHEVHLRDRTVLVLRRWAWRWVLLDDPAIVRRELEVLAVTEAASLPAPLVIAADPTGEQVGDGVPAALLTRVRGRPVYTPDVRSLAHTVHDASPRDLSHTYSRWCLDQLTEPPSSANDRRLWQRALHLRATAMPGYDDTFIHRDYHPGNVLWYRGRVSGVVDWALACRGPWECDIATGRADLRTRSGPTAADEFVRAYFAWTGRSYHPYWDLNHILEHGAEHWTAEVVRHTEPILRPIVHELDTT